MEKKDIIRDRLRKAVEKRKINDSERKKRQDKDNLANEIRKTINTIFVGAINKYEVFFGNEWGHGLEENKCSDEQLEKYEIWQQCRDEIMNLGNNMLRKLLKKIDSYEVDYKGKTINFYNKGE